MSVDTKAVRNRAQEVLGQASDEPLAHVDVALLAVDVLALVERVEGQQSWIDGACDDYRQLGEALTRRGLVPVEDTVDAVIASRDETLKDLEAARAALAAARDRFDSIACLAAEGPDAYPLAGKRLIHLVGDIAKEAGEGYTAARDMLAGSVRSVDAVRGPTREKHGVSAASTKTFPASLLRTLLDEGSPATRGDLSYLHVDLFDVDNWKTDGHAYFREKGQLDRERWAVYVEHRGSLSGGEWSFPAERAGGEVPAYLQRAVEKTVTG